MLPDIPDTKLELNRRWMTVLKMRINAEHPILAQIKSLTQHEGFEHEYQQIGFGMVSEGYSEIKAPLTIRLDEVPNLIGPALANKMGELAAELGKQEMQMFFRKLDETTEKAGTTMDSAGPITADKILQLIAMTQVDFDQKGKPKSSFVIHPSMVESAKKIDEQIANDPELKARAEAIRRKQYESWLARENNRKLVD